MKRLWRPDEADRSGVDEASGSASWADRGPGPWAIALLGVVAFTGVAALGSMLVGQFANAAAAAAVGRQAAGVAAVITDAVESVQRERGLAELVVADGGRGLSSRSTRSRSSRPTQTLERSERSVQAFGGTPTTLGEPAPAGASAGRRRWRSDLRSVFGHRRDAHLATLRSHRVGARPGGLPPVVRRSFDWSARSRRSVSDGEWLVPPPIRGAHQDLRQTSRLPPPWPSARSWPPPRS
jgi:hypothetical protein